MTEAIPADMKTVEVIATQVISTMKQETPTIAPKTIDTTLAINYTTSPTFRVVVGTNQKDYWLHLDLVRCKSKFFERCTAGDFKEAQENTIKLPEDSCDAFDVIVTWLYHDRVEDTRNTDQVLVLVEAYILADRLIMNQCQNSIMDKIRQYHVYFGISSHIVRALRESSDNNESPICCYVIDQYAYNFQHHHNERVYTWQS